MSIPGMAAHLSRIGAWRENYSGNARGINLPGLIVPANVVPLLRRLRLTGEHNPHFRAIHHQFVLKINLQGRSIACVEELRFLLGADDGILIFPFQVHHIDNKGSDEEQVHLLVNFTLPCESIPLLLPLQNQPFHLDIRDMELLNRVVAGYKCLDGFTPVESICALSEFLFRRIQAGTDDNREFELLPDQSRFADVFRYVREHFHEPVSIKTVAAALDLSESHLRRIFRQRLDGLTLGTLLRSLRMRRAVELLLYTSLPVGEIGGRCGFSDPFTFSRAFKKYFHESPLAFRQRKE